MLTQNWSPRELEHELRTPLTTILGMAIYLQNEPLSQTQQNYVNNILKSAKQLLNFATTLQQPHNDTRFINYKELKVLLVEDHPLIQQIHQSMLIKLNCKTDVASNAKEALGFASHAYDLIILDIGLPDLSGIELAKQIRNNTIHRHTRLLALTAYTDVATQKSCLEAGIEQVVHKPIDLNTLATVLGRHHALKEK